MEGIGGKDVGDGSGANNASVVAEEDGRVAETSGKGEVVEHDRDGNVVGTKFAEDAHGVEGVAWVHGRDGFVGEEEARAGGWRIELGECPGDRHALLLPRGKGGEGIVGAIGDLHAIEGGSHAGGGGAAVLEVSTHRNDGGDGEVEGDFGALWDVGDSGREVVTGEVAEGAIVEEDLAGAGSEQVERQAEEGGLAGTVGTEDGGHGARREGEGDIAEDGSIGRVGEDEVVGPERHGRMIEKGGGLSWGWPQEFGGTMIVGWIVVNMAVRFQGGFGCPFGTWR